MKSQRAKRMEIEDLMKRLVRIELRLTTHEADLLKKAAAMIGVSKADVVRMALRDKFRSLASEAKLRHGDTVGWIG